MKRVLVAILISASLLLMSCNEAPPSTESLVRCYNMSLHKCGLRIAKGSEEILPLNIYQGGKVSFHANKSEDYTIDFYVLDNDDYELGLGAIITENMILDSKSYDLNTDSNLCELMFVYDETDGLRIQKAEF